MSEKGNEAPHASAAPVASAASGKDASREKESGRIVFDARGNALWEWKTPDGQFRRDPSTTLVQRLESPELRIETTVIARKAERASHEDVPTSSGRVEPSRSGFNPYESKAGVRKSSERRSTTLPPIKPAVKSFPKQAGLLERLQSWVDGKGPATRR